MKPPGAGRQFLNVHHIMALLLAGATSAALAS